MLPPKITFCIPSKNNLRYLKWCVKSIRQNASRKDHEILVYVDADNDGTEQWLIENKEKYSIGYHVNRTGNLTGIGKAYDYLINLSQNEYVMVFHADMWLCKEADMKLYNGMVLHNLDVACSTRIEPPLHPSGAEKIVMDFGMWPETDVDDGFDENGLDEFVKRVSVSKMNEMTGGMFAPWLINKKWIDDVGGHDERFKSAREDSDIFNRFVMNGLKLGQIRDSFVYHLTCRAGQFEHGILTQNHNEKSGDWQKLMEASTREYVRKWHSAVLTNQDLAPIVAPLYSTCLKVGKDVTLDYLRHVEPFFDKIILSATQNNIKTVVAYCELEQENTTDSIESKIIVDDVDSDCDVTLCLDSMYVTPLDFLPILSQIADAYEVGTYWFGAESDNEEHKNSRIVISGKNDLRKSKIRSHVK